MDKYTNIEVICTGNNGRSPVGEAAMISQACVLNQGGVYICSSGTTVDYSKIPGFLEKIVLFVEQSIRGGANLGKDILDRLKENPLKVFNEMVDIEAGWRNQYIKESMNLDYSKHQRQQTIMRPEAQLILPVDKKNLERIEKIYSGFKGKAPRIQCLADFAGIKYNLTQNGLAIDYQDYAKHAVKVEIVARAAFLKAAGLD